MGGIRRAAAVGVMTLGILLPAGTAVAQVYGGQETPRVGPTESSPEVLGNVVERPQVAGAQAEATLPVTGGDIAALVLIGAGSVATGAVLVRRHRHA